MTGEVAVALLGFEDTLAPMKSLQAASWKTAVRGLSLALFLQVRDLAAFREAWSTFELGTSRYERVDAPPIAGVERVFRVRPKGGKGFAIAVFEMKEGILLTVGRAAYLQVRSVLEKRATALGRRVEGETWKKMVQGGDLFVGGYASFMGISRVLEERGAVPFFVRLIGEVYEGGVQMKVEGQRAQFRLEVRQ